MEYGLVVIWLVAYLAIGAAALPLSATLFSRFHDRGAAFAIPVGLATLTMIGYLIGHVAFGWPALVAGLLVLLTASYTLGDRSAVRGRASAEVAVVFTIAFFFLVSIRSVSPAIAPLPLSAGEKFLDFGLLQSLLRTDVLPPVDMWFAGSSVQYYFGGHLLTALLTTLTGTEPAFAYNLALSGFYAALVTGAYGLAGAIAKAQGTSARIAGVSGAFFVGLAGNLETAGRLVVWLLPDRIVVSVTPLDADADVFAWTPDRFNYWDSSRVIEGTINEFPLFAWLNGDLHAHMMSTPFVLLVAALCYSYWQTPDDERWRRRGLLATTAPVAGLLALTNTWSFPIAGGLVLLTIALAPSDPATMFPTSLSESLPEREGVIEELRCDGLALGLAVGVLVVGGLFVLPFWLGSASTRAVGLLPPRSDLGPLVLVHGGFLLVFVPYLAGRVAAQTRRARLVAAGVLFVLVLTWSAGFAAVGLFGPLLVAAWLLLRLRADVGFETLLMVAGFGLVLIVEFAHVVEPQYQGTSLERMNTVFKVYMDTWVLWAPAAGVALARLLDPSNAISAVDTERWRAVGLVVVFVALISTGLYAGFAVPNHLENDPVGADGPTLDGTAYVDAVYPEEAAAIAWIDDRDGQPTIVTAAPGGYWWNPDDGEGSSAPASLTGVPTVLGWFHEAQYRGDEPYQQRLDDVSTIYEGTPEEQTELFEHYDVEYVYVGPAERVRYDLTVDTHPDLDVAFEGGEVVVYEVGG